MRGRLDWRELKEAIEIFYRSVDREPPGEVTLRMNAKYLILDRATRGTHAVNSRAVRLVGDWKLKAYYYQGPEETWEPGQEYILYVDMNDVGASEILRERNRVIRGRIESALENAGYPVRR